MGKGPSFRLATVRLVLIESTLEQSLADGAECAEYAGLDSESRCCSREPRY